ncbi:hypothetical protein Goshw_018169, partial [Gossypium schwendimanii]|nr:hypothetical protein [Gossypium schwendimanii]
MVYQSTKRVIRYLWCGSKPTFLLVNSRCPSPCPSTSYFLGYNCYLIRFRRYRSLESTNHSNRRSKFLRICSLIHSR